MRHRRVILKDQSVLKVKQYSPKDFGRTGDVKSIILRQKDEFKKFVDPDIVGRKKRQWCQIIYNRFTKMLVDTMVDRLMESDRIEVAPGKYWDIGVTGKPQKHLNWHTDGKSYGVRIPGLSHVRVRMSKANRKELEKRIMNGQTFHQ